MADPSSGWLRREVEIAFWLTAAVFGVLLVVEWDARPLLISNVLCGVFFAGLALEVRRQRSKAQRSNPPARVD